MTAEDKQSILDELLACLKDGGYDSITLQPVEMLITEQLNQIARLEGAQAELKVGFANAVEEKVEQSKQIAELEAEIARHKSYEKELEIEVSDLKGDLGID